jgi:hypothetical protein
MSAVDRAAEIIRRTQRATLREAVIAQELAAERLLVTDEIQAVLTWAQRQVETHPQYAMAGFAAAVDAYLASRRP